MRKPFNMAAMASIAVVALSALTGCQVDVGGQTLPSPYYWKDDVQYFPAGPEFKLMKEATAQREFNESQAEAPQPSR